MANNPWFRLWGDMANDPKWRTIARVSKQRIGDVISVAIHMMTCASNADQRGHIEGWCDEDVATALDIDTEQVTAIRTAMQGRILAGEYMSGWEKRQPKREDEGGKERVAEHRAAKKMQEEIDELKKIIKEQQERIIEVTTRNEKNDDVTQCNAEKRDVTQCNAREEKRREEKNKEVVPDFRGEAALSASPAIELPKKSFSEKTNGSRLPSDWVLPKAWGDWALSERVDWQPENVRRVADSFRDYWVSAAGKDARKADWEATWRNWVRKEKTFANARASPNPQKSRHVGFENLDYSAGINADGSF